MSKIKTKIIKSKIGLNDLEENLNYFLEENGDIDLIDIKHIHDTEYNIHGQKRQINGVLIIYK
jgi:hypothetical protein